MSGGSKKQTVGYSYYLGMHLGICQGPVDQLIEIRAGDLTAWTGPVSASGLISINAPNLFGGTEREGGISGVVDVMMGESAQTPNLYLTGVQGAVQPAYRGILGLVFNRGLIATNNPYVKPWSMRLKRILAGWDAGTVWNSANAAVAVDGIQAMNPAHIVYQCYTDRRWGRGFDAGKLDLASFTIAASTFKTEGMGLCFTWNKQSPIEEFLQQVIDHAGAAVGEDPQTGLVRMKALRGDYTVGSLPLFSPAAGNIVELEAFDRSAPNGVTNEITVQFLDQATGKNGSITVQNLASVQAQGRTNPATKSYVGCPSANLATRLALRDILASTAGLARVRFTATRAAFGLLPGDVIAFSWPDYGVELMPLRIGRVNYGQYTRGMITIEAVQDVFGLPLSTYISPQTGIWVEPDKTPAASPAVAFFEAPYRELVHSMGFSAAQEIDPAAGVFVSVAKRPANVSMNYMLKTRISPAAYAEAATGDWTPNGTLSASIGQLTTAVTVANGEDLDLVEVGQSALIGSEIVRVDAINPTTGVCTIARGCADTVAVTHLAGDRVWFFEVYAANDPTEYTLGEVVDAKVATRTTIGLLADGSSPGGSVTMAQRHYRPYPPGLFRINSSAYPSNAFARLAVTWAHRDRLGQQDQLVDENDSSIGPEAGTTYTARIFLQPSTLVTTQTGIVGTSFTFDVTTDADYRVELEAIRGGLVSSQKHAHILTCEGANKVANGGMDADITWTKGTGWTIGAGVAAKAAGTASNLSQACTLVAGGIYRIDFIVTAYTAGTIKPAFLGGTTVNGTARSSAATFTEELTALSGNVTFAMVADAAFAGSIDQVAVRRVG